MYSSKVPSNCKVKICKRSIVALGLCDKHYRRFKKYGHVDDTKELNLTCSRCKKPFKISVPTGHTNYPKYCSDKCKRANHRDHAPLCQFDGCGKKSSTLKGGFCTTHKARLYTHGDPAVLKKLAKYPEGTRCRVEECRNKVLANYMCNKHYTMWKIHGDPKGGRYEYKIRKAITYRDGTRTCSECNKRLPIKNFHKDKNATDGYRSKCKECRIKSIQKWYSDNRERQLGREKKRRQTHKEKYAEKEALRYIRDREKRIALATEHSHLRKARKKKTKTERGISKLALKKIFGTKCYYCGKEMDFSVGAGRNFNRDMATIEHLVPLARGGEHTFENTVLACRHCNISKNAKSEDEFEEFRKS